MAKAQPSPDAEPTGDKTPIFYCKRCNHHVDRHQVMDVKVGTCDAWPEGEHPEVQWLMRCTGMQRTNSGYLPCGCQSYQLQRGTALPLDHPG